jgi:hypothetical protein
VVIILVLYLNGNTVTGYIENVREEEVEEIRQNSGEEIYIFDDMGIPEGLGTLKFDGEKLYREIIQPTPEPKQPTNAEVIQAISDLQADLIIAGVL